MPKTIKDLGTDLERLSYLIELADDDNVVICRVAKDLVAVMAEIMIAGGYRSKIHTEVRRLLKIAEAEELD